MAVGFRLCSLVSVPKLGWVWTSEDLILSSSEVHIWIFSASILFRIFSRDRGRIIEGTAGAYCQSCSFIYSMHFFPPLHL